MKKIKITALLISLILTSGGYGASYTVKGGLIGAGTGAVAGAIVGSLIGDRKGAVLGAAIGTAVGGGTGALIGRKMDKTAQEAAQIKGAHVEKVTDSNGLAAVKVTFESGILFAFNSFTLNETSKKSLQEFAAILKSDPTIDITVVGHTDKVGTFEANQLISTKRAQAVNSYLQTCGVSNRQFKSVTGVGYAHYDESLSADQNRRVEIFMLASEQMIKNAESESN
jgi:outer membrane protein OmpA-like peptidoglycan-associated protein